MATFITSRTHVPALGRYLKVGTDPETKKQRKTNRHTPKEKKSLWKGVYTRL